MITILDGGMGQELMARSNAEATALWSAITMRDEPHLVEAVHRDYFTAGAEIATTNSYILHRDRLAQNNAEDLFESLNVLACELANRARDQHGSGLVAGSIGPTGKSYRPDLSLDVEQGAEVYAEVARVQAPLVDFFLLETLASVKQAEGAVQGALTTNKPVWLSVTVDDENGRVLRSGEPIADLVAMTKNYAIAGLLVNCSVPEAVTDAMIEMHRSNIPFGAYANGFTKITAAFKEIGATVDALNAREDLSPTRYADFVQQWVDTGATLVGGCCEVGPEHINEISARFKTSI